MNEMDAMFERARAGGLWFFSTYQGLWFSPEELVDARSRGSFKWGACNWQLRSPFERLAELRQEAESAAASVAEFEVRMANDKGGAA